MMTIKHTPGPWVIKADSECILAIGPCVADSQDFEGASWLDVSPDDARLIAAAPDLLEALIEVTASLAWNAHGECRAIHDGPIMPSAQAVEFARAAIAKANGEQA